MDRLPVPASASTTKGLPAHPAAAVVRLCSGPARDALDLSQMEAHLERRTLSGTGDMDMGMGCRHLQGATSEVLSKDT